MQDADFYALIRSGIEAGRLHIRKHWARVERPCIQSTLDRIEQELRFREHELAVFGDRRAELGRTYGGSRR